MKFTDYLVENRSVELYESTTYNSLLEAVQNIAKMPPTWVVGFTKGEPGKGEFSKTIVNETVTINNKVAFDRVIKDSLKDNKVQGFLICHKEVPLFALVKDKNDNSSSTLFVIGPTQARQIKQSTWTIYTAHDAKFYEVHNTFDEKEITNTNSLAALGKLLTTFVSNYVKGSNDDMQLNDALRELAINIKTVVVETDNQRAQSTGSGTGRNSDDRSVHANKAIKKFSDDYLSKFIADYHKLVDKEVPNLDKAEELIQKSIDGTLQQININKVTAELKEYNKLISKFSHEYKTKKATNPTDPNWEEEFVKDFIDSLTATA